MKILFWNVQRLGGGSPEEKKAFMEGVIAQAFKDGVDMALFCEITSDIVLGDATLEKGGSVPKKTAKLTNAQLGYAAIDRNLNNLSIDNVTIPPYEQTMGDQIPYRGGQSFLSQSSRYVVQIDQKPIYLYHSNASYKSQVLVPWVSRALADNGNFILVGDLNVNPVDWKYQIPGVDVKDNGATHGGTNIYDYSVSKGVSILSIKRLDYRGFVEAAQLKQSDHFPIVVEYV